jgi:Glutamine amidotransferase domain/Asparagine synthase
MAGLAAIISDDRATPVSHDELAALARSYQDLRGEGRVAVASVRDWARVAKIGGEVGDGIEFDDASWAAVVGALHAEGPPCRASLSRLDGQFAAARYDGERDELQVFNDPLGMQALYVARRSGRTYASTSSAALARHLRAAPDPVGRALFLRTGLQFGPVTHWQGVERLDPATVLTFAATRTERATYWSASVDPAVRGMSLARAVDHCTEVGLETVRSHLPSDARIWADLTGGFDSRMVTALMAHAGVEFVANTSGEAEDVDVRLARRVAEAGGYMWQHERLPEDWLLSDTELRRAFGWGDGALEIIQLAEVLWRQQQRSRRSAVVVTGGGGEHFNHFPWMPELIRAGRSRRVNFDGFIRLRVMAPVDLSALQCDPTREVEDYCRARFAERSRPYGGELNTTQLDALYAYKSAGHFGAYRSAGEAFVRVEMPCYYKDLFSAAFSVHHRWRNAHRLQASIIERLNPAVAAIPTNRGAPAQALRVANAHRYAPYYVGLMRNATRKLRGRAAPAHAGRVADRAQRDVVRRLAAQGVLAFDSMRSAELYERAAFEQLLARARAPGFDGWGMIGRIATVEMAARNAEGGGA